MFLFYTSDADPALKKIYNAIHVIIVVNSCFN